MFLRIYNDVSRDFLNLAKVRVDRPDVGHLTVLMRAFGRLPYENLTKIVRAHEYADIESRIRTPDIVLADHVDLGAGGTCFSLTCFFKQILEFSGFDVYPVLCDRSYGADTHCALIARIGAERYLVDPGYLMEAPLIVPVFGETMQRGKTSNVRLARLGNSSQLLLFTEKDGKAKLRYRLKDVPVEAEKFRQRWIDSFDWAMMRHPCVSRMTEEGQLFMRDGKVRFSSRDKVSQKLMQKKFSSELEGIFRIKAEIVEAAVDCLGGVIASAAKQSL